MTAPDRPPDVETTVVAGVAVPETCRDRLDEAALRAVVDVLDAHGVRERRVSPTGALLIRIGLRRPDATRRSLRDALAAAGHGLTDHGTADGYRRLRVGLCP